MKPILAVDEASGIILELTSILAAIEDVSDLPVDFDQDWAGD